MDCEIIEKVHRKDLSECAVTVSCMLIPVLLKVTCCVVFGSKLKRQLMQGDYGAEELMKRGCLISLEGKV